MQLPWLKQRRTAQGCLGIEINHGRAWQYTALSVGSSPAISQRLMSQALLNCPNGSKLRG